MSMINTDTEKRKFKRVGLDTPIRYKFKNDNEFGSTLTRDVSEGGIRVLLDKFVPLNTSIELEFSPSRLSEVVHTVGKVVWARLMPYSERYQLGLEFQEISEHQKRDICDYVKSRRF